jgi:hypothetical protein
MQGDLHPSDSIMHRGNYGVPTARCALPFHFQKIIPNFRNNFTILVNKAIFSA